MLRLTRISILLAAMSLSGTVHAMQMSAPAQKSFTYRVRILHGAQSCADEAAALGSRFAKATGLNVTAASCGGSFNLPADKPTYQVDLLIVTYSALQEALPYRAVFGRPMDSSASTEFVGLYDDYASCAADFKSQADQYTAQTGLAVVAESCESVDSINEATLVLRIDGFGTPQKTLFAFQSFDGSVDAAASQTVEKFIEASGGSVVKQTSSGLFFYYANKSARLARSSFGLFENADSCTSQMSDAEAIVRAAGAKMAAARCPVDHNGIISLQVVSPNVWIESDYGRHSAVYYSFADCIQDKSRALTQMADARVFGGICELNLMDSGEKYELVLYSK